MTHEDLAQGTEDAFAEPVKVGVKLNPELLEPCYTPILQSGGEFDLKPSATSNEKKVSNSRRTQQPTTAASGSPYASKHILSDLTPFSYPYSLRSSIMA